MHSFTRHKIYEFSIVRVKLIESSKFIITNIADTYGALISIVTFDKIRGYESRGIHHGKDLTSITVFVIFSQRL